MHSSIGHVRLPFDGLKQRICVYTLDCGFQSNRRSICELRKVRDRSTRRDWLNNTKTDLGRSLWRLAHSIQPGPHLFQVYPLLCLTALAGINILPGGFSYWETEFNRFRYHALGEQYVEYARIAKCKQLALEGEISKEKRRRYRQHKFTTSLSCSSSPTIFKVLFTRPSSQSRSSFFEPKIYMDLFWTQFA